MHFSTILLILILTSGFSGKVNADEPQMRIFPNRITPDGKLEVFVYDKGVKKYIDVSDLDVTDNVKSSPNTLRNSLHWWIGIEPDFKEELLKNGYAKLRDFDGALSVLKDAQKSAQEQGIGIWKKTSADPSPKPSIPNDQQPENTDWKALILGGLSFWGGMGTAIGSVVGLAAWIIRKKQQKRIYLFFFGLPSTGKTWISTRLAFPDIARSELLKKKERTRNVSRTSVPTVQVYGRYELHHENIDIPGGSPGEQLQHMLRKRVKGIFARQIWIITISTTQNSLVNYHSPDADKIDSKFVDHQLGYLNLPIAALQTIQRFKPELIVLLVTKMDIFFEHETQSPSGDGILDQIFQQHVAALRSECSRGKIPFIYEKCSALEGWRIDSLRRQIHQAIFKT